MKGWSLASKPGCLVCPLCEAGSLDPFDHDSARCHSCTLSDYKNRLLVRGELKDVSSEG